MGERCAMLQAKMIILVLLFTLFCFSSCYPACGEISSSSGTISNPNYPYSASPNTNCTWNFVPSNSPKWLFLQFEHFHLDEGDYLLIEEKNATHKFKGIKGPFLLVVDATSNITLITTSQSNDTRFLASYNNQNCAVSSDASHGLITSPIYAQRSVQDSFTCSWTISPTDQYKTLLISFVQFQLNDNVLFVYKDSTEQIAKYTGNAVPPDVIVGSMLAKVEVSVQVALPVINFKAEFGIVALQCAKTIHINDFLVLSDTLLIPEPAECVWILSSDLKTTLMVKLVEVNLYNLQDSILLNDGNSRYSPNLKMIDFANKNVSGSFLTSSSNLLYISFTTIPVVGLSNFKLNISVQTQGGTFYDQGNFNFAPAPAFKGQDVVYTLTVNSSLMIEVSVEAENLQKTSEILFYEIQKSGQKLLATFNKETEFFPVFSKSNKMCVILRGFTGFEKVDGKFHGIMQGCDTFDQTNVGSYELQRNITGNCTWLIKPSQLASGDMVSLSFSKVKLNSKDIVAIYKSLSNNHIDIVQVFNSQIHGQPQLFIEARNGIRIDMQIESNEAMSQIIAFYELEGGCNNNISISHGDKFQISSVGYPSHYLLNMNCEWHVYAPANVTLFINFVDVDIYAENILQIYNFKNGSEELIQATNGEVYPDDVIISAQELVVKWNSTSHYEPRPVRGFSLNIQILDCGINYTSASGEISTPANQTVECIWGIAVPRPKSPSVNIIHLDVSETPTEHPSTFEIYDGGSLTSGLISFEANTSSLSRTNKLLVRYINKGGVGNSYKLSFSSKECTHSHQCHNGICMHDEWRCNGINDCGDFTDEENCDSFRSKPGVSMAWFGASICLALFFGIALTVLIPIGIRRFRRWREDRQPSDFSILPDESQEFE